MSVNEAIHRKREERRKAEREERGRRERKERESEGYLVANVFNSHCCIVAISGKSEREKRRE